MTYKTYAELKAEIEKTLDIEDEGFILPDELLLYVNKAIDEVEAEIHTLGMEDEYFLKQANISLISGTSLYSLPTDIYAQKIRAITYNDGNLIYPIRRMRSSPSYNTFEEEQRSYTFNANDQYYRYRIINTSAATGVQIRLIPASRVTSSTYVTIYYIRNANRMAVSTDICDIPEFYNYVIQSAMVRCMEKEPHPLLEEAKAERDRLRELMRSTLSQQVLDEDTQIEQDLTFYQDHL